MTIRMTAAALTAAAMVAALACEPALAQSLSGNPVEELGSKASEATGFVLAIFGAMAGLIGVVGGLLFHFGVVPTHWFKSFMVIVILIPIVPTIVEWWTDGAFSGLLGLGN